MSLLGNFLLLLFLWILVESIRVVEDVVSLRVVPCIGHLFIEVGEATIWSWKGRREIGLRRLCVQVLQRQGSRVFVFNEPRQHA